MKSRVDSYTRLYDALLPMYSFVWRLILALTMARILLVFWQWDRVVSADMNLSIFVQGLRFDLVLAGMFLSVPVLLFPILASNKYLIGLWRSLLVFYLPAAFLVTVFLELSTPSFVDQFDSRPNILFVEYLNHPKEVFATLWAAYKLPMIFAVLIVAATSTVIGRKFVKITSGIRPTGLVPALALAPVLLIVCVGMVRSTIDHRPVNPSTVALSNDPLVNDLALNSAYTVLYAIYETRHEAGGGVRYGEMDNDNAIATVRGAMDVESWDFTLRALPTLHMQHSGNRVGRQLNLVIIVEESLGAEFVGSLGGLNLTPNLDRQAASGIWFSNLYATGTRSVRGLEAIVSGFTPTSARSVVKLGKSQRDFFTLAALLGREGYDTSFIYGGQSRFDNMRRFFMNNGFDRTIDEDDYVDPVFTGSWGVSDEDLFTRAHEEFSKPTERPFFSLVFTSSNHSPFQFPDGRIELYDETKNTVNNAVKYADYALGEFLANARQSNYWEDTVFLIVADHNSRVYGSEIVPVSRFHIPGLILGGTIEASVIGELASQVDLAPTLLSLIGIDAEHPMIGHDLTRHTKPGRAIMQFNGAQAYMEAEHVAVLQKDLSPRQFLYRDGQLVEEGDYGSSLTEKAIAHSLWSSIAYENSLHRLPGLNP